jgi:hypothetical protein
MEQLPSSFFLQFCTVHEKYLCQEDNTVLLSFQPGSIFLQIMLMSRLIAVRNMIRHDYYIEHRQSSRVFSGNVSGAGAFSCFLVSWVLRKSSYQWPGTERRNLYIWWRKQLQFPNCYFWKESKMTGNVQNTCHDYCMHPHERYYIWHHENLFTS